MSKQIPVTRNVRESWRAVLNSTANCYALDQLADAECLPAPLRAIARFRAVDVRNQRTSIARAVEKLGRTSAADALVKLLPTEERAQIVAESEPAATNGEGDE